MELLILLVVMFLLSLPDHTKHPAAGMAVEYGWLVVLFLAVGAVLSLLRGCAI